MSDLKAAAATALACLDLTNLNDDCTADDIRALAGRAVQPMGSVAALCVWSRFVTQAREIAPADVKIATVVVFPTGEGSAAEAIEETRAALQAGADEIDMVIPYRDLMEGRPEAVRTQVERVKRAAGDAPVKAILETGVLADEALIRQASEMALLGGADFLKTSTGKVPVNATLSAARLMLEAIREHDRPGVGFKAAGGIRTAAEAAAYLELADEIMGEGWAGPATFRFGASGLLDALVAELSGVEGAQGAEGY